MINDIEELALPIINIYGQIELDLIVDIARRFDTYDDVGGSLEWQLKKLDELGALNNDAAKTIARYSKKTEAEIVKMLNEAGYANIDLETVQKAFDMGVLHIDPKKAMQSPSFKAITELSYKQVHEAYKLINTKALESVKQAYMDVINRSYVEVASGIYDYQTSISRGIQRMAAQGITAATYRRGGKTVKYSIEAAVRRDTLTAVHQLANKTSEQYCRELAAQYVETSAHLGARVDDTNPIANHAGWQGKVYKIDGSDEYPNLKEATGYPDDILGLGGVNCRHRIFPFVPGVSVPNPQRFTDEENRREYELSQKQRAYERKIRRLKKQKAAAQEIGDTETAKKLNKQIRETGSRFNEFCERNGRKRDYARERVAEQMTKKGVAKSAESGIIDVGSDHVGISLEIDRFTPCLIKKDTGEIINTEYCVADKSDLKGLRRKGWNFDWSADDLKDSTVYKLMIENDTQPQGLIAVTNYERDKALYINIAESAPHNIGDDKMYEGVGGHLFAIAARESLKKGNGGYLFLDAKNMELVKYYSQKFGAKLLGMPHPYRMFIDEEKAAKLLEIYTFKGGK